MTAFCKLALIATATLAAMVSAAPVATTTVRQTSATPVSLAASSSQDNGPFSGRGTWFTDSVGSCGTPFDTNDMIVAMNGEQMGDNTQCGRTVQITSNGKTVKATVVDTCPSEYCATGALDLSQAVFEQLAPLSVGVIQIEWSFV
ncbi:hypothetical protein EMPS_06147 [Entomortierella parvispora]|uniref:RlpA-like protein double-psi beta-barrel domain-containing protein n=1 Tax=Entomortierella parvispora TaxID=205924 RepID=A0A9P3HBR4_9FUNG|nr:hypothetical protein EMPS_06147 [Entomortierella parvispora]